MPEMVEDESGTLNFQTACPTCTGKFGCLNKAVD